MHKMITERNEERRGMEMRHKLIIDGNAVYEIDDECMACQEAEHKEYSCADRREKREPNAKTEKRNVPYKRR